MNKLNKIYEKSKKMDIDDDSKIVIMSDCHRGIGNDNDNFAKNKIIYTKALEKYYYKNFIYIELGDGDDMWEVKEYEKIIDEYIDIFRLLKKFNDKERFVMIYGNHDICKKRKKILKKYFYKYHNKNNNKDETLLNNIEVYEALTLNYKNSEIFMLHGHQIDFLNSNIWWISRFLVRYVWKALELTGIEDLSKPIKNNNITGKTEKKLNDWSLKNNKLLISGHTHNPIYPNVGDSLYFNDGSCIHSDGITCLEIENGKISLVKWIYQIKEDKISVERKIIDGNICIEKFLL